MPNDLLKRRAVSLLKIKIPNKVFGRERCGEGFNSGVRGLEKYWPRIIETKMCYRQHPSSFAPVIIISP
jgi:hypothetical protein